MVILENEDPLRLIVGMSRGGTTALVATLNQHRCVAAFGETLFFGNEWVEPKNGVYGLSELEKIRDVYRLNKNRTGLPGRTDSGALDQPEIQRAVLTALEALKSPVGPATVFRTIGTAVAATVGARFWVEKTPHHLMHFDRIMENAPNTRMIVSLRAPEAFLLSYKFQGGQLTELARKAFRRSYHPLAAGLVCRGYLRKARQAAKSYPMAIRIFWLEELSNDDGRLIADVLEHLDLPPASELSFLKSNSSFSPNQERPMLAPEDLIWLKLLVGGIAKDMGLAKIDAPFAPIAFLGSLLVLPIWTYRVVVMKRKRGIQLKRLLTRWLR